MKMKPYLPDPDLESRFTEKAEALMGATLQLETTINDWMDANAPSDVERSAVMSFFMSKYLHHGFTKSLIGAGDDVIRQAREITKPVSELYRMNMRGAVWMMLGYAFHEQTAHGSLITPLDDTIDDKFKKLIGD